MSHKSLNNHAQDGNPFHARLCYSLVADIIKQVEQELLQAKAVSFLCDYPWSPGKRLRPITFLLSNLSIRVDQSKATDVNGRESSLASAIELLHEASLIHDDLVDKSEIRRGVPSMQMQHGEGLSLLIGDYMIFQGLKSILDAAESEADIVLARELTNTGLNIAHGEADQLDRYLNQRDWQERMAMDNYLDIIAKKTAAFFAGCAEAGAALGGASIETREVFREFGMKMGILFQMTDDMIDILGNPDVAQKSLRNNLEEGTVTLPMIVAWELHIEDEALCKLANGETLDAKLQEHLYEMLAQKDILDKAESIMRSYSTEAKHCLSQMPVNIYTTGLADLLDYITVCPWGGISRPADKITEH